MVARGQPRHCGVHGRAVCSTELVRACVGWGLLCGPKACIGSVCCACPWVAGMSAVDEVQAPVGIFAQMKKIQVGWLSTSDPAPLTPLWMCGCVGPVVGRVRAWAVVGGDALTGGGGWGLGWGLGWALGVHLPRTGCLPHSQDNTLELLTARTVSAKQKEATLKETLIRQQECLTTAVASLRSAKVEGASAPTTGGAGECDWGRERNFGVPWTAVISLRVAVFPGTLLSHNCGLRSRCCRPSGDPRACGEHPCGCSSASSRWTPPQLA